MEDLFQISGTRFFSLLFTSQVNLHTLSALIWPIRAEIWPGFTKKEIKDKKVDMLYSCLDLISYLNLISRGFSVASRVCKAEDLFRN